MTTREKILEAALRLFNEKGHTEVKVRQIARDLKISPGNLSYHFPKKEDIIRTLLEQHSTNVSAAYAAYAAGEPTVEQFLHFVLKNLKSHFHFRGLFISYTLGIRKILEVNQLNYEAIYEKRIQQVRLVFEQLRNAGQIQLTPKDLDFLVSFFTLFIRFSIMEAHMIQLNRAESDVLRHYMSMITHQIELFATEEGLASLRQFQLTD